MSIDDDGYGDDYGPYDGGTRTRSGHGRGTRTLLPERAGGDGAGGRRPARASRSLITVVGVVMLLVAAIAFANRGGGGDSPDGKGTAKEAAPTAPTGERPVSTAQAGIASGFPRTEQGAQSAAANYAVALTSADVIKPDRRPEIVRRLFTADKVPEFEAKLGQAYSQTFLDKLGLDRNGNAAKGMTYVSRTAPIGTRTLEYADTTASIDVWCTGVFGTAGISSKNPVTNDWFTMQLRLRWTDGDWKIESATQKEGPAPVNSDRTASNADEITKAVTEFGGFTYAR
ncbi:hypothetical protein [Streptomyces sp. URMC 123]|uniref:hypothetical protein n=1 Tax=Streptomyces sp. URMC 123 TaxID=3423403 RepID=UPI003F1AAECD